VRAQFGRIAQCADFLKQASARFVQRGRIHRMRRAVEHAAEPFDGALRIELIRRVGLAHAVEFERRRTEEEQNEQHGNNAKRPWRGGADARLWCPGFQISPLCRRSVSVGR